ncbi:MAG: helicase-related protein [Candidatus Pacearchaeota archaeon]
MRVIPDVIDNNEHKLFHILNQLINKNSSVYIATGYFNLGGFALIKDKLKIAKEVKILIGKEPESIISPEQLESLIKSDIEEKSDEEDVINLVKEFLSFIEKENVEIRIYKDGSFHGKFYVIDGGIPTIGSIAIVGSSNFTYAGLTGNTEYNSVIKQSDSVNGHKKKFLEIFNKRTEDYKPYLLSLLSRFTDKYSPHDIYIKILYSYFEDKLLESPNDNPSPIILADFQRDGYISALRSLEKYGGVILSDSVGLGKTYLGLRILDDFAYRLRQKALIICPAQIKDTIWEPKLKEFGIRADVISQEKISRDFDTDKFKDYDLILVDESHNFRNSNTKRWKNLFQIIVEGKNTKKIVLLTATPVNNNIFDLYNQLRFITKDNDEFFKSAGINSLWGYFLKAHFDRETLYDLLEEIVVRRSRQFIKKYYPNAVIDDHHIKFPDRELHTIKYHLTEVYAGIYKYCVEAIESLTLVSYNLDEFRKEIFNQKLQEFEKIKKYFKEKGWDDKDIQKLLMQIGRSKALIEILKILLLKRLESSIEAFKISISNLLHFQKKFLETIKEGKILDRETYRNFFLSQENDEEDRQTVELKDIDPNEYEIDEIIKRTEEDIKILENILDRLNITPDKDVKLQKLVETLAELKNKKVVIFGYFKDTMRYIYNYISKDKVLNHLGIPKKKIDIIDSEINPEKRRETIERFSPISNGRKDLSGDEEIQILFSTDVLSEGQNLQDADTIINYDLPWNPVKIVQRIGRLDRIGSPYDVIHVYNFFPEDELESLLRLLQRLYEKLDTINRSIGLDSSVLGETPNPKDFGYIRDIFAEKKAVFEEIEKLYELAIGEFMKDELLKYLHQEGLGKINKIPNGVGSCIKRENKKGVFAAFKDKERHYWCFYDINEDKILENRLESIKIIRCSKDEPFIEPSPDIDPYKVIKKLKNHIISRLKTSQVKPMRLTPPQNIIVNYLQLLPTPKSKDLIEYYSTPLPKIYLQELRKLWTLSKNLDRNMILKELEEFKNTHPLVNKETNNKQEEINLKLIAFIVVSP